MKPALKSILHILAVLAAMAVTSGDPAGALPSRDAFLSIAKKGWVYEFRSSVLRRQAGFPPIRLNSKEIVFGSVCLIGDRPHALTKAVIETFDRLLADVFGRIGKLSYGGSDIASCGPLQRTYIRIYGGAAPEAAFNDDLRQLNDKYQLGLSSDRWQRVRSPAQANAFFGRKGTAVHILVKQPKAADPTPLEKAFYTSILIEELFQAFTYGMDIPAFDRKENLLSKLQERPVNLRYLAWDSEAFMRGLVESNPKGLCSFDVFMLHALANSVEDTANSSEFLVYIRSEFDDLLRLARTTLDKPDYAEILDPGCRAMPK